MLRQPVLVILAWLRREPDDTLVSVGEDVYGSRMWAIYDRAPWRVESRVAFRAGEVERKCFDDACVPRRSRLAAGERAYDLFSKARELARADAFNASLRRCRASATPWPTTRRRRR